MIESNVESQLESVYADFRHSFGEVASEVAVRDEFWSYGEFELPGHGKQTNEKCGTFNKFMGCLLSRLGVLELRS